jgi:septal ring factor EnvC (AmiA/AmiB activator)
LGATWGYFGGTSVYLFSFQGTRRNHSKQLEQKQGHFWAIFWALFWALFKYFSGTLVPLFNFPGTRRNHSKQLEQMQFNIEAESKSKAEAMRMRKKLELDIGELDSALEHAHLANLELQKNIKSYQDKIREKTLKFEAEQLAKDNARERMMVAERNANTFQNGLEEAKTVTYLFAKIGVSFSGDHLKIL